MIFDAEDRPEPQQLRKAAATFRAAERRHSYHRDMHQVVERLERLLTLFVLLVLGILAVVAVIAIAAGTSTY